jgi:uncharacterized metal-binding protein
VLQTADFQSTIADLQARLARLESLLADAVAAGGRSPSHVRSARSGKPIEKVDGCSHRLSGITAMPGSVAAREIRSDTGTQHRCGSLTEWPAIRQ